MTVLILALQLIALYFACGIATLLAYVFMLPEWQTKYVQPFRVVLGWPIPVVLAIVAGLLWLAASAIEVGGNGYDSLKAFFKRVLTRKAA